MFTFPEVQREIGEQNANRWEQVWYDLLQADGFRAGLNVNDVQWDHRTSAPDQGRDVVVTRGAPNPGAMFIPAQPSVWSVKSGANGLVPATLGGELRDSVHPELVKAIKAGMVYRYCVCRPAGQAERKALEEKAQKCAAELRVPAEAVKVYFDNHLCEGLKGYPGVLKMHCPLLGRSLGLTVSQWGTPNPHFDTRVRYVDFDGRAELIDRLVQHLAGAGTHPVLHIGGLSGIGKTRLVYQACIDQRVSGSMLYYDSPTSAMEFVTRVRDNPQLSSRFVVDECSLNEHIELRNRLQGYADRVRVVSIGPAGASDQTREPIFIVPPPKTQEGVLLVLKSHAGDTVPGTALQAIAEQSAQDLRFALLMLEAVRADPELLRDRGRLIAELADTRALYGKVLSSLRAPSATESSSKTATHGSRSERTLGSRSLERTSWNSSPIARALPCQSWRPPSRTR
jgi:hypothetical protein